MNSAVLFAVGLTLVITLAASVPIETSRQEALIDRIGEEERQKDGKTEKQKDRKTREEELSENINLRQSKFIVLETATITNQLTTLWYFVYPLKQK